MTLPSSYDHFHSAWESTEKEKRTLENLRSRIMIEESRMIAKEPTDTGEALFVRRVKFSSKSKSQKRPGGKCFKCGEIGHYKNECTKNRQPSSSNTKRVSDALICDTFEDGNQAEQWFLDSGASDHMTNRSDWFRSFESFQVSSSVSVGNGDKIKAIGRGDIDVRVYNGKVWNTMHLKNVLYVPDIKLNLFSTGQVLNKGYVLNSDMEQCRLPIAGAVVAVGVRESKLFKMMFKVIIPQHECVIAANVATRSCKSLKLWHERFGHQSIKQVKCFLYQNNI